MPGSDTDRSAQFGEQEERFSNAQETIADEKVSLNDNHRLARPNKITDDQTTPFDWAEEVLYNPAGQMTQLKYYQSPGIYYTETRNYNAQQQLTRILSAGAFDMRYIYSATQNKGRSASPLTQCRERRLITLTTV